MPWPTGWIGALAWFWRESAGWRGRWVLFQYTALMWSRRGFPVAVPLLLAILRIRKCRTAVVFHDVYAVPGPRWIDRFRVAFQRGVMRCAYLLTHRSMVPIPLEIASWLPRTASKASFIPVGANVPAFEDLLRDGFARDPAAHPRITAFGISSWPAAQRQEIEAIVYSVRQASTKVGELSLMVFGRGAKEAEPALREGLLNSRVTLTIEGLLDTREVSARLCASDVMLFVRGPLSSRRGSGLAGIACELPMVAYEGRETGFPLTQAGILFAPQDDLRSLADQLTKVLSHDSLRDELRARNRTVFREWYSWDRIATRFIHILASASEVS